MKEFENIFVGIISFAGIARSCYIEAIQEAKKGDFDAASKLIEKGQSAYIEGHRFHAELLAKEASGENISSSLIVIHAEDQMMSAETFGILAEEFIDLYKKYGN